MARYKEMSQLMSAVYRRDNCDQKIRLQISTRAERADYDTSKHYTRLMSWMLLPVGL